MTKGYLPPPQLLNDDREHRRQLAQAIAGVLQGKINVTQTVTLTASATSTVVQDPRIGANSALLWSPLTASAAANSASIWVGSRGQGVATLNHSSNPAADMSYIMVILG